VSRAADRFEPVEGRPLVPLPEFHLEERTVETLAAGEAPTWVVVPAFDEAASIMATLASLEAQTLRPLVVCIVDNASRDGTASLVRAWAASLDAAAARVGGMGVRLVHEPEKGTGAAADTGMRVAIAAGATNLLRTDADSLPRPDWAARMVTRLDGGAELIAGRMVEREDEALGPGVRLLLKVVMTVSSALSVPKNRGRGYRTRFRMLVGSNVGIRSDTYVKSGGFPRCRIDECHDDRALMNRTRRITDRIVSDHTAIVGTSARRYRRYGLRGVLDWYLNHETHGATVDVR
jgi:glycosyltransferase involved in cell wall biosynthesis